MNNNRVYKDLRQGDVLNFSIFENLISSSCLKLNVNAANGDICVVVSQDCDIVGDENAEPFLEFIVGNHLDKMDGNCQYGKNPRILHLLYKDSAYSFSVHNRFFVRKINFGPIEFTNEKNVLSPDDKKIMKRWLGRRYTRAAFPDEFNKRLSCGTSAKIIGKKISANISHIFFDVCDDEFPDNQDYDLNVLVVVNDGLGKAERDEIENEYLDAFSVKGINLTLSVVNEDEVTLADLKSYRLWEKEGISISKGHAGPIEEAESIS